MIMCVRGRYLYQLNYVTRIVSRKHDDNSDPLEQYYETPYALLDSISPLYRESFSSALAAKLMLLESLNEADEPEWSVNHEELRRKEEKSSFALIQQNFSLVRK